MSENIPAIQSSVQIAESNLPKIKKHTIKKGETLWGVSKTIIKESGENATNKKIILKMNDLAKLNGKKDFQSLSKNFWKPGIGSDIIIDGEKSSTTATTSPKAKVTVEEDKTSPKTPTIPKAEIPAPTPAVHTPKADKPEIPAPSQNVQEAPKPPKNPEILETSKSPFAVKTDYKAPVTSVSETATGHGVSLGHIKKTIDAQIPPVTPKAETPKAEIAAPTPAIPTPETPKGKVLNEQEKAELRHQQEDEASAAAKAKATADAKAEKAKTDAEIEKLLAQRNAEEVKATPKASMPKPEATKLLTRPDDAKYGDKRLWSRDDRIYQTPDGNNYGRIKSGGNNLYYDMQNHKIVSRNNRVLVFFGLESEMGEVDFSDLDKKKTPDIADEIDKLDRH